MISKVAKATKHKVEPEDKVGVYQGLPRSKSLRVGQELVSTHVIEIQIEPTGASATAEGG